ncbi:MAG: transcription termination/antitermination protein NusA [Oscillospiraceae bacterium]|jgi:N utilization substance protein A|nr:transcription termination/antitermination protein NusA [Oscillospiraceae bacterium]MCI2132422.1 transcription termination factor NusA [Eubacterium sp.]
MNTELLEALNILEREKNISKDTLLEAIQQSLLSACKKNFGTADNVTVSIDPDTCDYHIIAKKEVVENVDSPVEQISLEDAQKIDSSLQLGDIASVEIQSRDFKRIATHDAKNVILQKIREEERRSLYNQYFEKEHDVVTGVVQRYIGRNVSINLGKIDALLTENEMVRGETLKQNERVKVYVLEVRDTPKGPKVLVSRTHPELVKRLFEEEVAEVREGIIEIKAIAREAGSRTKIAVWSNDPDVDAVGACVGVNGSRVNTIVSELNGEKVDVINWDENQAYLIENALSPAKVISVMVDPDEKSALVIVPDYQLSLAIGREGQNARLAAHLTQYKIDIKSETQAREEGIFEELEQNYEEDEYGELKEKDSFEEEEDFREETGLPEEDPEAVSEEPDVEEEEASVEETAAEEDASVEEAAAEEDAEQ